MRSTSKLNFSYPMRLFAAVKGLRAPAHVQFTKNAYSRTVFLYRAAG